MRLDATGRVMSGVLCTVCLAVLVFAAWLSVGQAEDGSFTQESGLAPCGFHAVTGRPCATCGMTRSFAMVSAGRVSDAAAFQPVGAGLAVLTGCVVWLAGLGAATGSRLGLAAAQGVGMRGVWVGLGILAAGWAYTFLTWP